MSETPMMRQYLAAKAACPDALLLFRMGDFYELFHEDARVAAKLLGLTLTSRDKSNDPVPMAGFPHHQLDSYIAKLIRAGKRVAVCEQVEDPRTAQGLVKRQVTHVLSPGTIVDPSILDPGQSNFLAAICRPAGRSAGQKGDEAPTGLAWADLSSGGFAAATLASSQLPDLLERLNPAELLVPEGTASPGDDPLLVDRAVTVRPAWSFGISRGREVVQQKFKLATLEGLGFTEGDELAIAAAGAILEYLQETQAGSLEHLAALKPWRAGKQAEIDQATWRSLEITRTIRTGSREGSLLGVIDRCETPMGSRLLGQWLMEPLLELEPIRLRHDAVGELVSLSDLRNGLRSRLSRVFDLERLIARVVTLRATPRELRQIGTTLGELPEISGLLASAGSQELVAQREPLEFCRDLRDELDRAIEPNCPATLANGGCIRSGYDPRLDELRDLASGGKQWIASYQQKITAESGIPSLKIGFNKVFGYYLEVTNTHQARVPDWFIRKQTLKNVERYVTPELKEYEERVLAAESQALELEQELFQRIRDLARAEAPRLMAIAAALARLDVLAGLAELAVRQNYCRPEVHDRCETSIRDGRHPVLDLLQPLGAFVPNDTKLGADDGLIHLITGPNMAGKSTYIRQVALISLLAQIGSFVPAREAAIGIADRFFARVGASDELSRGQSTFMVEMTETARILNTATHRSLVILDEIGRGTSTYDGVSLAWAITEFLHEITGCRTLFATHYHELTRLDETFASIRNYNVSVREWDQKIVFLHKIVPGAADRSYGIHVAQLAGVPEWVNLRAQAILDHLEQTQTTSDNGDRTARAAGSGRAEIQLTLFAAADHPLLEKIRRIDTDHLTPITALHTISAWQRELCEKAVTL
jgi:DNA mismatch repair protein MutS